MLLLLLLLLLLPPALAGAAAPQLVDGVGAGVTGREGDAAAREEVAEDSFSAEGYPSVLQIKLHRGEINSVTRGERSRGRVRR